MSYSIWIKVEDDDGSPGDRSEAWWAGPGEFATRREAIEHVEDHILSKHALASEFDLLDSKWTDEDDAEEAARQPLGGIEQYQDEDR